MKKIKKLEDLSTSEFSSTLKSLIPGAVQGKHRFVVTEQLIEKAGALQHEMLDEIHDILIELPDTDLNYELKEYLLHLSCLTFYFEIAFKTVVND